MSGYFRRLIARSAGSASDIRPLSAQPYAALSHATLQAGKNDQLIDTHHTASLAEKTKRDRPDRDKILSAKVTGTTDEVANKADINGTTDSSILMRPAKESAVITGKSHTQTMFSKTRMEPLFDGTHEMISQHLSHEEAESSLSPSLKQPVFVRHEGTAANASEQADRSSTEAFHLMPLQSSPLSHKTVSSSTITPIPSFSSMRDEKGVPSHAHLFASETYHPQANVSESPSVQVSIGRIEIRATASQAPSRKVSARSPTMSLNEYLKQRNGGQR